MRFLQKQLFAAALPAFMLLVSACGENKTMSINDRYPMPWREANAKEQAALGKTIAKKDIKVCGEYYVRPGRAPGEYLIGCTADANTWNYYVVNAVVDDVAGPIQDSTIAKPR